MQFSFFVVDGGLRIDAIWTRQFPNRRRRFPDKKLIYPNRKCEQPNWKSKFLSAKMHFQLRNADSQTGKMYSCQEIHFR